MKKLFVLALLVGAFLLIQKLKQDRAEWQGLTRSDAITKMTDKLNRKMAGRIEPEQVDAIARTIVDALVSRGIVVPDPDVVTSDNT